ncbi:hypothetical protein ACJX0J_025455, partial [Zea mays]
ALCHAKLQMEMTIAFIAEQKRLKGILYLGFHLLVFFTNILSFAIICSLCCETYLCTSQEELTSVVAKLEESKQKLTLDPWVEAELGGRTLDPWVEAENFVCAWLIFIEKTNGALF